MNEPIRGNLTDYFNAISNSETAQKIEQVITSLSLPVPEEGQFLQTRDYGAVIYMENHGCVIRITHDNRHPYHKNDFILEPLAALTAGYYRIHINPGLSCPIHRDEIGDMVSILASENLGFNDCREENAAYLPYKTVEFPNGIPVVIDEPAVSAITEETAAIFARPLNDRQKAAKSSAHDIQDRLFAPLRDVFRKAWQTPENTDLMHEFWIQCRNMKKSGLLTDSWNHTDNERILMKHPKEISRNYAGKLRLVL